MMAWQIFALTLYKYAGIFRMRRLNHTKRFSDIKRKPKTFAQACFVLYYSQPVFNIFEQSFVKSAFLSRVNANIKLQQSRSDRLNTYLPKTLTYKYKIPSVHYQPFAVVQQTLFFTAQRRNFLWKRKLVCLTRSAKADCYIQMDFKDHFYTEQGLWVWPTWLALLQQRISVWTKKTNTSLNITFKETLLLIVNNSMNTCSEMAKDSWV